MELTGITCRIVLSFSCVVILDVIFLALIRHGWVRSTSLLASGLLMGFIALGALALWESLSLAPFFRLPVISLFLAGCIIYMEMRSLLSRGYSLRILLDLLEKGGQSDLDTLKSSYGRGMGISGLITKRIETLSNLKLLRIKDNKIGPLTPLGCILAKMSNQWRTALRLDQVG